MQKLHQVRIKNKGTRYFQSYVSLLLNAQWQWELFPGLIAQTLSLFTSFAFLNGGEEGKASSAVYVWDKELSCLEQCIIFPKASMWLR